MRFALALVVALSGYAEPAETQQQAWSLGEHKQRHATKERDDSLTALTAVATKKALVLSIAHGPKYSPKELAPFVQSARKVLPTEYADIVFLVDEAKAKDASWIHFCTEYGVQVRAGP
jgi:hypothetical protein